MLNYIWMALLILGIGAALVTDVVEQTNNKYRNGIPFEVEFEFNNEFNASKAKAYEVTVKVSSKKFNEFYSRKIKKDFSEKARLSFNSSGKPMPIYLTIGGSAPLLWREMAAAVGKKNDLMGKVIGISFTGQKKAKGKIIFEKISFVKMKEVTNAAINYSKVAVTIALGLIGIMALWLGVMKVAEEAGLIQFIARVVRPITKFLFPDVPQDHPAMGSIIMNISANMLGLGNAATPFGLKAMEELESLNPNKGVATNAMVTFLAINTAGLTLIPATAIAIRAAMGSADPTIIIGTSIFGASAATITGITMAKLFEKFPFKFSSLFEWIKTNLKKIGLTLLVLSLLILFAYLGYFNWLVNLFSSVNAETFKTAVQIISTMAIPLIIFVFILYGFFKKVDVYEKFVEGAKEGFDIAVKIIPYLVGMLVAIGIFRAGGMMDVLTNLLAYPARLVGMPPEVLPMALIRPLSGSGSAGVMTEIMTKYGPDSLRGIMASTFFGSTETTFYVLAVYFGSVNIRKTRHAVPVGLLADLAGILAATFIVNQLFG